MPQRFTASQWVPYPVEMVFAFFANPSNLPHLMPPRLGVRIEDQRILPPPPRPVSPDPARRFQSIAAGVGSEMRIAFRPFPWFPRRLSWQARIVEFVWNSHFTDEQAQGPFNFFRHRHGIAAERRDGVEGTLVADEIEFEAASGWLGDLGAVFVRRQLDASFAHRQQRLPETMATVALQAARRG
jgi:ligand-binding SRPBCC domain-containing protein